MAIEAVKVNAEVHVGTSGGSFVAKTPRSEGLSAHILSFTVTKTRSAPSTFSASLKVRADLISGSPKGNIIIKAGTTSSMETIFTGLIKSVRIRPCFDDPKYLLMDLSGTDILQLLQGKKFTARSRLTKSTWISINGVSRKGLRSGVFKPTNSEALHMDGADVKKADDGVITRTTSQPMGVSAPQSKGTETIGIQSTIVSSVVSGNNS